MAATEDPVPIRNDFDVKINGHEINGVKIKSKLSSLLNRKHQLSGINGSSVVELAPSTATDTLSENSSTLTYIERNGGSAEYSSDISPGPDANGYSAEYTSSTRKLNGTHEGNGSWEDRTFACQKHQRPARFPEPVGALPFPREFRDLVAWTDSFVERLGWSAMQKEEEIISFKARLRRADDEKNLFTKDITDLQTQLKEAKKTNDELRETTDDFSSKIKVLELEKASLEKRIVDLKNDNSKITQDKWDVERQNATLIDANDSLTQLLNDLTRKYELDEDRIRDLQEELDRLNDDDLLKEQERETIVAKLEQANKAKLAEIEMLNAALIAAKADLLVAEEKVNSTFENLKRAVTSRDEKFAELQDTKAKLRTATSKNAGLDEQIRVLKRDISYFEQDIRSLNIQLTEANAREKETRAAVGAVQEHARTHWSTLQSIRTVGGWSRQNDWHECDKDISHPAETIPVPYMRDPSHGSGSESGPGQVLEPAVNPKPPAPAVSGGSASEKPENPSKPVGSSTPTKPIEPAKPPASAEIPISPESVQAPALPNPVETPKLTAPVEPAQSPAPIAVPPPTVSGEVPKSPEPVNPPLPTVVATNPASPQVPEIPQPSQTPQPVVPVDVPEPSVLVKNPQPTAVEGTAGEPVNPEEPDLRPPTSPALKSPKESLPNLSAPVETSPKLAKPSPPVPSKSPESHEPDFGGTEDDENDGPNSDDPEDESGGRRHDGGRRHGPGFHGRGRHGRPGPPDLMGPREDREDRPGRHNERGPHGPGFHGPGGHERRGPPVPEFDDPPRAGPGGPQGPGPHEQRRKRR